MNDAAADDRWVTGDHFGLPIPADPAALCDGGTAFLMVLARRRQRLALRPAGLGLRRPDEYRHGVRAPLQMLTNALNLWDTAKFGDLLDAALS